MTNLLCAVCRAFVARVHDTRFGLAPPECLCRHCSLPAYARA